MSALKGLSNHPREVEEIMGAMPPWIQRWGYVVPGLALIVIVCICAYIRIPEKITIEVYPIPINAEKQTAPAYDGDNARGFARVPQAECERLRPGVHLSSESMSAVIVGVAEAPASDGMCAVEVVLDSALCSPALFETTISESSILQLVFSRRFTLDVPK